MPTYNVTRQVPYSADQVFAISSDVAQYKHFLPLVRKSVVRGKSKLPDGRETFEAELTVAYKKLGIEEVLHSNVVIDRDAKLVTATSEQGPVKHLKSEWRLVELSPNSCEINFTVDYALKSKTLQFVLSGMFDMMVRKVLSSFEERARELYGSASASA
jgi:coenzyme Q-binding protein COQ10